MATLGGDLIRMLAHGGISTLGNVGAQLVGDYLKTKATEKLLGTQANLEAATYEQDPNKQQQILGQLKDRLGLATVQESGMVPIGETPTMENLGVRKNLTYPEAGYTPATVERIVAPIPKFETAIGARAASALPELSPQEALSSKLKDPDRELKQLQILGMLGDKDVGRKLQELGIRERADAARRHDEIIRGQQETTNEFRRSNLELQRDRFDQQRKAFALIAKKVGDQAVIKHSADVNAAWDDFQRATSAKKPDPLLVAAAVEKYNKNVALAEKMVPELTGHFTPLGPEYVQTLGEWVQGKPGTKVKGYKPVTNDGAPKATAPVADQTSPPAAYLTNYKAALAANVNNPDAVAEIQKRAKSRYPNYKW